MALKIRLARGGAKKRPFYKIVVAEATSPRDGKFIERVGSHNPMLPKDHAERIVLKLERIKYWLSVGAQPTDRVTKFLANVGVVDAPKIPAHTKQHLPRKKAQERMKAEQERLEAAKAAEAEALLQVAKEAEEAAQAALAAAQAALAAAEAPVEEATPAVEEVAAEAPAEEAAPAEEPAAE
jgi:small subunit ribosomal protein S16